MSYTEAYQEALASAPKGKPIIDTLELYHPAFLDEANRPTAIRIAKTYEDWLFKLEAEAIVNGGEWVTFLACEFNVQLPEVAEDGKTPNLQISVGNVSREITRALEQAKSSLIPIKVTYRPYLPTDPSIPQMNPPIVMEMSEVDVDVFQATGTASLEDINNVGYPSQQYTTDRFPGLRR